MSFHGTVDWSKIPAPVDDGAACHLAGSTVPSLPLTATDGSFVDLAAQTGTTVVYFYPMTSRPNVPLPDGWDLIPGARGCTPQSCAFRDHFAELKALGVTHMYGLSTQDSDYQREAVERLRLPFQLLSDHEMKFAEALQLPTFETLTGMTLLKRLTCIIRDGKIVHAFYPVFPPDRNAADVVRKLSALKLESDHA